MKREICLQRRNWQNLVEEQGMHYHTIDNKPYWDESAFYQFHASEVDEIEKATYALNEMCLEAVQYVIDNEMWQKFWIPVEWVDAILFSWEHDDHSIYGRFDLVYDGIHPPKMLEYNADTPTALLEASVIQWHWMEHQAGMMIETIDQFNSIHEKLIEAWDSVRRKYPDSKLHFTAVEGALEDFMTANYMRDTAIQAGWSTTYLHMEDLRWDHDRKVFVDKKADPITICFKLYPWEWMFADLSNPECPFGPDARLDRTMWLEPMWKCILSNKAILPVLYELFPDSPYLLKASFDPIGNTYAKKPILSREGANVTLVYEDTVIEETKGDYTYTPYIYQELQMLPDFNGNFPVVGSWMINGYACGIGIREDNRLVTGNTSRFVPHLYIRK
jgi:glutathionylspermidine synthase